MTTATLHPEMDLMVGVEDFAEFESLFEEEIPCQSIAGGHGCTNTVTHKIITRCGVQTLVCSNRIVLWHEEKDYYTCAHCHGAERHTDWRVIPV